MTVATPAPGSRTGKGLVLAGIIVLSVNLRPAAVSVGPVLEEIRSGLGMSSTQAGVLTSLPVLAFAVFGGLAPRAAQRFGRHRLTLVALLAVVVGLFLRAHANGVVAFLAFSLLALAGMASANVVIPSLVKLHFPDRIGLITSIYTTALAIGLTAASVLTVPIADAAGDWRDGLEVWAFVALVATLPWLALVGQDARRDRGAEAASRISLGSVARTRIGVLMALFFGFQSLHAYAIFGWLPDVLRSAGYSAHTAGLLLGVVTGTSIPLSFVVPRIAARDTHNARLIMALVACYPVGYVGLIIAPHAGAIAWALFLGVGTCTFPLVLTLIGLRARTPEGTSALSGFTQSAGYLLSVLGPFGFGFLHDLSGGWTVPLLALTVMTVPLALVGLGAARTQYVEDQLG